ncbi:MAG: hypothetical protein ABEJ23_05145 [Haloarculaceae archaeon]
MAENGRTDGGSDRFCERHAWASVGVTVVDDDVTRVWICEQCPAWSGERLDPAAEIDWQDTRLSQL